MRTALGRQPFNPRDHYSPQQREIIDTFRAEEYIKDRMDVQPGHAWDSIALDAGERFHDGIKLFEKPIGQPDHHGRSKTYADTSMRTPNAFLNPEAFAIRRVLFTFSKSTQPKDMYAVAEQFTWRLWMGKKTYLSSPIISLQMTGFPDAPIKICDYCRSVWANDSNCPGCGARQFELSTLGGEVAGQSFVMDLGKNTLVLDQGVWFGVTFEGDEHWLSAPLKLWCHFEGLHARGVQ